MVMLCFVLDLQSLLPPLLRDLKQSLLQLANFYAISSPISEKPQSKPNRFGLCYLINNRITGSSELKVAYCMFPERELQSLRFPPCCHQSAFSPTSNGSGDISCSDLKHSSILSSEALYSWIGDNKDISRKVILIGSSLLKDLDSVTKGTLMDAADKCVSVEFVLLEQKSSHVFDLPENKLYCSSH